ncbi:MAG: cupin domain-containing protein [Pyrinomonadaceae bacterium]
MSEPEKITCDDLEQTIERYTNELGYRLDMIMPADAPREALMSKGGDTICLMLKPAREQGRYHQHPYIALADARACAKADWITGRAGMMYRDLIPDRLGGKTTASHIRIVEGGEVPDSVHYHKIAFQMIYCVKGAIRVVYEDQGPPFWLKPGDCVLQPPEIRHRVLEAEAGSEVIEITSPAEHETWFDHESILPTSMVNPQRIFGGQYFVLLSTTGNGGIFAALKEMKDKLSEMPSPNINEIINNIGMIENILTIEK